MRRFLRPALAVSLALAAAGCSQVDSRPNATPPAPPLSSPSSSSTPLPIEQMTIGLDGISYEHDGIVDTVSLADGSAILALFESVNGYMPTGTEFEFFAGYPTGLFTYKWSEVIVTVSDQGPTYNLVLLAPAVNSVPIRTHGEIAVGSTRMEAIAAGARDEWDNDKDGIAEELALGAREVPGTHSLSRPGSVGSEFLLLVMDGDNVVRIIVPGDDFSDI